MRPFVFLTVLCLLIFISCQSKDDHSWSLQSPDKQQEARVVLEPDGSLTYSMLHQGRELIGKSALGIVFEETSFVNGLQYIESNDLPGQHESYQMLVGKQLDNEADWNELQLNFINADGHHITFLFRLYDEGLAFRYAFPARNADQYKLVYEASSFQLPAEGKKWLHPYDTLAPWSPAYETFYENGIPVGASAPWNKNGWAFPMLFEVGQDWLLITEADLGPQYVGMHISDKPDQGLYALRLPEEGEAEGACESRPTMSLPIALPWRVIMASDRLAGIVESNLVYHLATPTDYTDMSWIQPGRSSWSWWSEHDSPRDYNRLREYIDFTADIGWEYFLVDANWNHMTGGSLEELTRYAHEKGVGILVWYNSGGRHNVITEEPRDLMDDAELRRAEFKKISEWGVRGVKVDFFQSDKACIIEQYHGILKDAADYHLLVNFHGSTLPRGWERTYPNLMTMESVRGGEAYNFDRLYPDYAPWHNTILVFTRNVVGSMDYTPVAFSDVTYPHQTTFAHELALGVLFESGIQHFADRFESYLKQPDYVLEYLRNIPVSWDETRFVTGYPGELAVLARRNGDTWYLSGINGKTEAGNVELDMNFLPAGNYHMTMITDGDSDRSFSFQQMDVSAGQLVTMSMRGRGGFAGTLKKED